MDFCIVYICTLALTFENFVKCCERVANVLLTCLWLVACIVHALMH
jgi:hypothetical protein